MIGILAKIGTGQISPIEKHKRLELSEKAVKEIRTLRKTSDDDFAVIGVSATAKSRSVLMTSVLNTLPAGQHVLNLKYVKAFRAGEQWPLPQGYAQSYTFQSNGYEFLETDADVQACLVKSPASLMGGSLPKLPVGFRWKPASASCLLVTFDLDGKPQLHSRHMYDTEVLGSFGRYMDALGDIWGKMDGQFFQMFVQELFTCLGFQVEHCGRSADGGVDLMLMRNDPFLGTDTIAVQCKNFQASHKVDSPVVTQLRGALPTKPAQRGIVVTTSTFTGPARQEAAKDGPTIHLMDGADLGKVVLSHIQELPTVLRLLST